MGRNGSIFIQKGNTVKGPGLDNCQRDKNPPKTDEIQQKHGDTLMHSVLVQVSVGELLDKLVILELKASRIPGEEQQKNIRAELVLLQQSFAELALSIDGLDVLIDSLRQVNSELWEIEDNIRTCEQQQRFDNK